MAAGRSRFELTEAPSPRKIARALSGGFWPRSALLSGVCSLLACVLIMHISGTSLVAGLVDMLRVHLERVRWPSDRHQIIAAMELGRVLAGFSVLALAPVVAGLFVTTLQVGFRFRIQQLAPDLGRLNPAKGLQRALSIRSYLRYATRLCLGLALLGLSIGWLWAGLEGLSGTGGSSPERLAGQFGQVLLRMATRLAIALGLVAVAEYLYGCWTWWSELRMSRAERQAELRDTEGDRLTRFRRRQRQFERAASRAGRQLRR